MLLLDPAKTDAVLEELMNGSFRQAYRLDALLHNTVNVTVVHGGGKTNVIPSRIDLELDGRVLPGFTPEQFITEIHELVGDDIELEVLRYDAGGGDPDMSLFPLLQALIQEADPEAVAIPAMVGGFTDGRMFTRMGIQNYGCLPAKMPEDFNYSPTVHGANERVPVETLEWGADVLFELIKRYGKQ